MKLASIDKENNVCMILQYTYSIPIIKQPA